MFQKRTVFLKVDRVDQLMQTACLDSENKFNKMTSQWRQIVSLRQSSFCLDVGNDKWIVLYNFRGRMTSGFEVIEGGLRSSSRSQDQAKNARSFWIGLRTECLIWRFCKRVKIFMTTFNVYRDVSCETGLKFFHRLRQFIGMQLQIWKLTQAICPRVAVGKRSSVT